MLHNLHLRLSFPVTPLLSGIAGVLAVAYIGLIAVVMSYAVLTVEFSQSIKNDEAAVATLESQYLAGVTRIQEMDYHAAGYVAPVAKVFVPAQSVTALR